MRRPFYFTWHRAPFYTRMMTPLSRTTRYRLYIFILVYIETSTRLSGISTVISIGVPCGTSDEAPDGTCRRYPTTPWDAPQVATGLMQCSLGSCGVSRRPYVGPIGCSRLIGRSVGVWVFHRLDIVWALPPHPKCIFFFFKHDYPTVLGELFGGSRFRSRQQKVAGCCR